MKIEKESDALRREYRQLVRTMERLTRKYTWDQIEPAWQQIFRRQGEIIKELEECTGIQITCKTREETLKEIEEKRKPNPTDEDYERKLKEYLERRRLDKGNGKDNSKWTQTKLGNDQEENPC